MPWAGHHQRCSWWRERVATAWAALRRSQGWHSWSGYQQTPYHASHQTKLQCLEPCKGKIMNGIYDQGYIHTCIYSKTARIFHSIRLCYSMIKPVSKWIRREGEIPFLNKCLCCMYPHWLYLGLGGASTWLLWCLCCTSLFINFKVSTQSSKLISFWANKLSVHSPHWEWSSISS